MNRRQMQLDLSIGLLNLQHQNVLQGTLEQLHAYQNELGEFLNLDREKVSHLNQSQIYQQFTLYYEFATLQIGVATNAVTSTQTLEEFRVKAPLRLAA